MSRSHPQQWTVGTGHERPDPADVAALAAFPTTQLADCGGSVSVVGPGIGHVAGGGGCCGPAVTVWTKPGDILFVLAAPEHVTAGDVLVIDGGGRLDAAVIGDIIGAAVVERGGVGLVVDGAVRDVEGLAAAGLPTFARGVHPATASNAGPGAIGAAVQLGGVAVRPGDVVRADDSGVVVVPREHVAEVVALAAAVDERERTWRAAIAGGASVAQATGVDLDAARRAAGAAPPAP